MAEKEEPAVEEEEAAEGAAAAAAKKKKIIMLAAVGVVLLLLAGGGTFLALSLLGGDDTSEHAAQNAGEHGEENSDAKAEAHEADAKKEKVSYYEALDPAFLANFMVNGRQRYVQVAIAVMARDETGIAALKTHMPLVRNRIVMLLSGESFEYLQTDEGRVQLQQKLLAAIQEILNKETGKPGIEQVYFTNFVMQ